MKRTTLSSISLGTFIVFALAFYIIGASTGVIPSEWWQKAITLSVFLLLVFAWDVAFTRKFEEKLFRVSVAKSIPRFLISFVIAYVGLFVIGLILKPEILQKISGAVTIPWYYVIFHLLFAGIVETLIFFVYLPAQLKQWKFSKTGIYIATGLMFALFHYWAVGGELLVLFPYVLLGMVFLWIRLKYGWESSAGSHWAYNLFLTGFV